jgi:hypothetical protein
MRDIYTLGHLRPQYPSDAIGYNVQALMLALAARLATSPRRHKAMLTEAYEAGAITPDALQWAIAEYGLEAA